MPQPHVPISLTDRNLEPQETVLEDDSQQTLRVAGEEHIHFEIQYEHICLCIGE